MNGAADRVRPAGGTAPLRPGVGVNNGGGRGGSVAAESLLRREVSRGPDGQRGSAGSRVSGVFWRLREGASGNAKAWAGAVGRDGGRGEGGLAGGDDDATTTTTTTTTGAGRSWRRRRFKRTSAAVDVAGRGQNREEAYQRGELIGRLTGRNNNCMRCAPYPQRYKQSSRKHDGTQAR